MLHNVSKLFSITFWKTNFKSGIYTILSVLYIFCDDHTDKIIALIIFLFGLESKSKHKGDDKCQ